MMPNACKILRIIFKYFALASGTAPNSAKNMAPKITLIHRDSWSAKFAQKSTDHTHLGTCAMIDMFACTAPQPGQNVSACDAFVTMARTLRGRVTTASKEPSARMR